MSVPHLSMVPPPSLYGTGAHGTMNGVNGPTMTGTVIRPQRAEIMMEPSMEPMMEPMMETMMPASQDGAVDHIPLAKTRVLYLGSAVPIETANGLEAVQMPLRERYATGGKSQVEGIDTWLSVFSSGLVMQYVGDKESVTWWPISALHVCAAVKCVVQISASGEPQAKFVALDSSAGQQSTHPPMFAAIMRRTKGVKVLECHIFICKADQAAMALVQSSTHAYEHKELWTSDQPPMELLFMASSRIVPADDNRDPKVAPEFYEKPPPQGYFYSSSKDLVRNYNVGGDTGGRTQGRPKPRVLPPPPMMPLPPPPMAPPMMPPPGMLPMPPPGMMMPPPGMMMPPPGLLPMPPPPVGYFNDWDAYAGRPVATFPPMAMPMEGEYQSQTRRRSKKKPRSPERRRRDSCSDDSGSEFSEYYYERRPKSPPADYRESPYEYDRHVQRYGSRDDYARGPPRDHHHDDYARGPERDHYVRERHDRFDRREPDDLVLYAPRYARNILEERPPQPAQRQRDEYSARRLPRERDDDIPTSAPPPPPPLPPAQRAPRDDPVHQEIIMKESEDYREARRKVPDYRQTQDVFPSNESQQHYPRNDREFGNSIREERNAVGDLYSDNKMYQQREEIDFGNFQRGDESSRQRGRPFDNLENSLGYFP